MATKKRSRDVALLVTIGCKVDGKPRAMVLRRHGHIVKGTIFNDRAPVTQAVKSVEFGDGETLHTALHALGVWSWGSDGDA